MSKKRKTGRAARSGGGLGKSLRGVVGTGKPLPGVRMPEKKVSKDASGRQWVWYAVGALLFTIVFLMLAMTGCAPRGGSGDTDAADTVPSLACEAALLDIYDCGGYVRVDVRNPWDTTAMLGRYALVGRGDALPDSLPEGYTIIRVPLARALVYSSVHASLIEELGAGEAVGAVADGEYFTSEPMAGRIRRGEVRNVGSSQSPSLEAVMAAAPDAVLLSPFENSGHGVIDQCGIPVIECADYMEDTPLGRAEWMKFFGRLFGRGAQADSLFSEVCSDYHSISAAMADAPEKPLVLTEMLTDGYWFVPGGRSYMARMIQDAGGVYPWASDTHRGSLQLDYSSVYAAAAGADVWLLRSYGRDLSLDDISGMYLLNGQFRAYKTGNVWVANTARVPLYEEFPFHPERLLREYAAIFHPSSSAPDVLRYYRRAR